MNQQQIAKQILAPSAVLNQSNLTNFGSVVNANIALPQAAPLQAMVFTLDNSAGMAVANYIIGDALGIVAATIGGTFVDPDSVNGAAALVDPIKQGFNGQGAVLVGGVNYETSSDAAQFAQNHRLVWADKSGTSYSMPWRLSQYVRNNAYNPLLLTLTPNPGVPLSENWALVVPVLAGEVVTLTLLPNGYTQK